MLISNRPHKDSILFRQYYVGMTRAKNRLFIHTNSNMFDHLHADRHVVTTQQYPMPEEVVLQLSHKDLYLDFFKPRKKEVLMLRSGDPLEYKDTFLFVPNVGTTVAKLSSAMHKELSEWQEKGYHIRSVSVRFIVAWKSKDEPRDKEETAVLLPDIILAKG